MYTPQAAYAQQQFMGFPGGFIMHPGMMGGMAPQMQMQMAPNMRPAGMPGGMPPAMPGMLQQPGLPPGQLVQQQPGSRPGVPCWPRRLLQPAWLVRQAVSYLLAHAAWPRRPSLPSG